MANFKKVHVDSRFRSSGTPTRFTYDLPETLTTYPECRMYVGEFALPITWDNVADGHNQLLLWEFTKTGVLLHIKSRVVTLPNGSYTGESIVPALQAALNSGKEVPGDYTVARDVDRLTVSLSANGDDSRGFWFFRQRDNDNPHFRAFWNDVTYSPDTLPPPGTRLVNDLLGFRADPPAVLNPSFSDHLSTTYEGGVVDMRLHRDAYLCSENMTNFRVLGPNGARNVIKRIGIDRPYGYIVNAAHSGLGDDWVPVGSISLKSLQFSIRDAWGNVLDTNGVEVSFSLIFSSGV